VPDGQSAVGGAAAVAAVAQTLVAWLGERHQAGDSLEVAPSWRIAENRWSAARYGVEGELSDLQTGARRTTREVLHELLDELEPVAARLSAATELSLARSLIERNGAIAQREVAAQEGMRGLGQWLAECFLAPMSG
jgi:carboxylate-amine ligase